MGLAMEVIVGRVTNPNAAFTALTPGTGNAFTVRNADQTNLPYLEGLWALNASAGSVRIRSPFLHDQTQGIRFRSNASQVRNLLADNVSQQLRPQDTLTVEMTGGAAETDMAALLISYPDLPGINARLAQWEQIRNRIVNILTAEVSVTGPTTAGDWSAGTLLNASEDLLKPNVDYAILGYQTDTEVCAVGIAGTDTGNLKVGGPGTIESLETRDWFVSLAVNKGAPRIPVINAANKASTNVFVAHTATGGTVNVDLVLAQLSA